MSEVAEPLYRQLILYAAKLRVPAFVLCNLTYRCPFRCKHCYVDEPRPDEDELTAEEYDDLFGQLARAGTMFLTFSGGEVLARPDLLDLIAAARARGFAVSIFTAGWGLDEAVVDAFARLRVEAVEISLHAATPALHDGFVGYPGAWENAVAAARALRARGVRVALKMNIMNFNWREWRGVFELAKSIGATFKHSPYVFTATDGRRHPLALRLSDDDMRAFFEDLYTGRAQPVKGDRCDEDRPPQERPVRTALGCGAAFSGCSISPYGDVWPCVAWPRSLGNIRERPFIDIWQGEEAAAVRALAKVPVAACAGCELTEFCSRCAALALVEEGDVAAASREHCRVARFMRDALEGPKPADDRPEKAV